jgi:hypothetical protein
VILSGPSTRDPDDYRPELAAPRIGDEWAAMAMAIADLLIVGRLAKFPQAACATQEARRD